VKIWYAKLLRIAQALSSYEMRGSQLMKNVTFAVCGVLGVTAALCAQTGATFEVASVKLNPSMGNNVSINLKPGGVLECTNASLPMLITMAYNVRDNQISGAPGWAESERYDIVAKPSAEDRAAEPTNPSESSGQRMRQRLQALLAERFGVVLHTEDREMPVYALVVAKGGAKMTPSTADNGPSINMSEHKLVGKKVSMQRFAEAILSNRLGRTTIDETGLKGEYDFVIEFAPEEGSGPAGPPTDFPGAPFLTAMREQLGLRVEAAKGPVKYLIIDKAEHPSAN
jgi:uncharacterized protein (TIGR03435 family)